MTLSINSNSMARNTARNLDNSYSQLAVSVRRLSSGLRVNSAADDAAGLAIRELMRADVAALNQGVRNANDAISMLQVADGALGVIDEKLIRMKELAEQAATGTYDSTQRLIIHSEFVAMAEEIDRIANATDFNGIKLLDGSLSGTHDGSGLNATGRMKIHFGTANDSAEDYYYVEIGDCTLAGLGLAISHGTGNGGTVRHEGETWTGSLADSGIQIPDDLLSFDETTVQKTIVNWTIDPFDFEDLPPSAAACYHPRLMSALFQQGEWHSPTMGIGTPELNPCVIVPKGTKNFALVMFGSNQSQTGRGDNDIEVFALDPGSNRYAPYTMVHLVGTPLETDPAPLAAYTNGGVRRYVDNFNNFVYNFKAMDTSTVDTSFLNTGPSSYDPSGNTLQYMKYHGMTIGYSGDADRYDSIPNDGILQDWDDFEVLVIDELTEDLIIATPGIAACAVKMYWDLPADTSLSPGGGNSGGRQAKVVSVKTQDEAQKAITRINDAIVKKDTVRAHLGAMQNRLENTVTNIAIQAETLQAAESRISDADVATEMTQFVRNQILTQSAVALLGQANSYPHMLMNLLKK